MIWLALFYWMYCIDSIITPISCTYFLFRNVGTESPCPTITPSSSPAMTLDFRLVTTWIKTIFGVSFEFQFHRIFVPELNRNLCQKLFFLQNIGSACCVQKLFWVSETISVHNMFFPGLSLEFSCIELVIQWTICRHIVGSLMQR